MVPCRAQRVVRGAGGRGGRRTFTKPNHPENRGGRVLGFHGRGAGGARGAETKTTRPLIFHCVKGMKRNLLKSRSSSRRGTPPPADFKGLTRSWLTQSRLEPTFARVRSPPAPLLLPAPHPLLSKESRRAGRSGRGEGAGMLLCGPQRPAGFGSAHGSHVQTVTGMSHHTHTHKDTQRHACTRTYSAHTETHAYTRTK